MPSPQAYHCQPILSFGTVTVGQPAIEITKAKIVSNRLKEVLTTLNLSQEELARRVGISYRQVNRVVLGRSQPSLLLAECMAVVLGEPASSLFKFKIVTRKRVARP